MLAALLAAAIASQPPVVSEVPPERAPRVYVTPNHFLTFRPPRGVFYCPLPDSWTGSDHGTVLFLTPPKRCGGAGYPSSGRSFRPEDTPRIEVYYGYDLTDDDAPPEKCAPIGSMRIMGHRRPLCRLQTPGMKAASVSAKYQADSASEVVLNLVSHDDRFAVDLVTLRAVAASLKPCKVVWMDQGKAMSDGKGARCPKGKWF